MHQTIKKHYHQTTLQILAELHQDGESVVPNMHRKSAAITPPLTNIVNMAYLKV